MSTLIQDLKDRGMLDSTLVVWMGEFGRGPRPGLGGGISGSVGGGHYARAWTTVLAGAGLRTGQVIGRTDPQCVEVEERPVSAIDFFATICRALGIDPHKEIGAPGGRPHYITPRHSRPIQQLFA
jgi:arylsulfatase A-like enzyme